MGGPLLALHDNVLDSPAINGGGAKVQTHREHFPLTNSSYFHSGAQNLSIQGFLVSSSNQPVDSYEEYSFPDKPDSLSFQQFVQLIEQTDSLSFQQFVL